MNSNKGYRYGIAAGKIISQAYKDHKSFIWLAVAAAISNLTIGFPSGVSGASGIFVAYILIALLMITAHTLASVLGLLKFYIPGVERQVHHEDIFVFNIPIFCIHISLISIGIWMAPALIQVGK